MSVSQSISPSLPPSLGAAAADRPLDRLQQLLPDLFEPKQQTGDLFLRFQLGQAVRAAISLERVVETLQIPATSVTPLPNMPPAALGLMSNKGKVFWAIDLARLLELPSPVQRSRRYEVIIIQALPIDQMASLSPDAAETELLLGLVVSQIRGTLRLQPEEIVSPEGEILPELVPYLQGQIESGDDELMLLSVEAISNARGLMARRP